MVKNKNKKESLVKSIYGSEEVKKEKEKRKHGRT